MKTDNQSSDGRRGRPGVDGEAWRQLIEGVSASQVMQIFGCSRDTASRRLRGVKPSGRRGGADIYRLADVAMSFRRLTAAEVERAIARMAPGDLPRALSRDYWAAQRSRQIVLREAGDLYSAAQVIEMFGEAIKRLDMQLKLLIDSVDRRTELNEAQRQIIQTAIDGARVDMARDVQAMAEYRIKAPHPMAFEEDDEI